MNIDPARTWAAHTEAFVAAVNASRRGDEHNKAESQVGNRTPNAHSAIPSGKDYTDSTQWRLARTPVHGTRSGPKERISLGLVI
jgi:hypothetical protein